MARLIKSFEIPAHWHSKVQEKNPENIKICRTLQPMFRAILLVKFPSVTTTNWTITIPKHNKNSPEKQLFSTILEKVDKIINKIFLLIIL